MRIDIELVEGSVLHGDLYFSCNGQTILLSEVQKEYYIDNIYPGEYEICIYNKFCKKVIEYILMWLGYLLIAPINILLMNTESDWGKGVHPTTVLYRCRMLIKEDVNLRIYIKPSRYSDNRIFKYTINIDTVQEIPEESTEEKKNPESIRWEMNKFLSKFFSYEAWGFTILCFIFVFSSLKSKWLIIGMIGFLFLILFLSVALYTIKKAIKIKGTLAQDAITNDQSNK